MQAIKQNKLLWVLGALFLITALSWSLNQFTLVEGSLLGISMLVLAFVKVRLIIIHFMEASHAALPLRLAFEGWIVLACVGTVWLYMRL